MLIDNYRDIGFYEVTISSQILRASANILYAVVFPPKGKPTIMKPCLTIIIS